jgi:hypothetical protein
MIDPSTEQVRFGSFVLESTRKHEVIIGTTKRLFRYNFTVEAFRQNMARGICKLFGGVYRLQGLKRGRQSSWSQTKHEMCDVQISKVDCRACGRCNLRKLGRANRRHNKNTVDERKQENFSRALQLEFHSSELGWGLGTVSDGLAFQPHREFMCPDDICYRLW